MPSVNINLPNNADFFYNQLLRARLENVSTLPGGLGAAHKGYSVFNLTDNKPYCWDGTQWLCMYYTGAGGGSMPQPTNTAFVSPGFSGYTGCYFNDIGNAFSFLNSRGGGTCIIYPGTYTGQWTLPDKVNLFMYEGVVLTSPITGTGAVLMLNNSLSSIDGQGSIYTANPNIKGLSITGTIPLSNDIKIDTITSVAGADAVNITTLNGNCQCNLDINVINGNTYIKDALVKMHVNCFDGTITTDGYSIVDIICLEFVKIIAQGYCLTKMQFSRNFNEAANDYIVYTTEHARLELIDGTIKHHTIKGTPFDSVYSGGLQLRLKHVKIDTDTNNGRNIWLQQGTTITDNCTLINTGPTCIAATNPTAILKNWGSVSNVNVDVPSVQWMNNYLIEQILVDTNVE